MKKRKRKNIEEVIKDILKTDYYDLLAVALIIGVIDFLTYFLTKKKERNEKGK